jgi:DNA-directed RNA polymerase specialized sigma24 family protein
MAQPVGKIHITLNSVCAAYVQNPEKGQEPLLAKVRNMAKRAFQDEDDAQEFVIMTWKSLPDLKDLPWTLSGWIWRRLQWRRIDYIRGCQSLLAHEVQVPEMADENGDSLSAEESLDLLAFESTLDTFTERFGKLDSISHPFVRRVAHSLLYGYTQDEIAVRLGVNPATLRSRLSHYRHGPEIRTHGHLISLAGYVPDLGDRNL